jgi:cytoskeleton protein RodZ
MTALPNPVVESAPSANPAAATEATPATTDASPAPATTVAAARAGDAPLVLAFKGTSWAEVKDATGRVILQVTGTAGITQTVSGAPPLELSLGNAPDVAVTFRGQTLDLAPYTRGVVARVSLK